jgi:hypothetical protein
MAKVSIGEISPQVKVFGYGYPFSAWAAPGNAGWRPDRLKYHYSSIVKNPSISFYWK